MIAGAIAVAGALYFAYHKGEEAGHNAQVASQKDADDKMDAIEKRAADGAASVIAQLQPKYVTIQGQVRHEVETHTVYRDCQHSADGLRLVNSALQGGSASEPAGAGELSASHAAR